MTLKCWIFSPRRFNSNVNQNHNNWFHITKLFFLTLKTLDFEISALFKFELKCTLSEDEFKEKLVNIFFTEDSSNDHNILRQKYLDYSAKSINYKNNQNQKVVDWNFIDNIRHNEFSHLSKYAKFTECNYIFFFLFL